MSQKLSSILALTSLLFGLQACGKATVMEAITGRNDDDKPRHSEIFGEPLAMAYARSLSLTGPSINSSLKNYANCEALQADLNKTLELEAAQARANLAMSIKSSLEWELWQSQQEHRAEAAADNYSPEASKAPSAGKADSGATSDSFTNVQEQGVDEADQFRIGKDQIYAVSNKSIQVIDRASLKQIGSLTLEQSTSPQLFTRGDKLVVMERHLKKPDIAQEPANELALKSVAISTPFPGDYYPMQGGDTRVRIFKTKAGSMPELLRDSVVTGSYVDSRLIESNLVLVMNDQIDSFESKGHKWEDFANEEWYSLKRARELFDMYQGQYPARTLQIKDGKLSDVPCESIAERKVHDFDMSLAKTVSMNIDDANAKAHAVASIGQGDQIYVTSESIYLLKNKMQWFSAGWASPFAWNGTADEKTYIRQIALGKDGSLTAAAEGEVPGRIKDQWALHGVNAGKNLVIATSTGQLWAEEGPSIAQNHLFVLEKDESAELKVVGSVRDYGTKEDIRAVRYIGDKAYVVTFKKTDPLYAFDLSDLKAPRILSGLKIPGFSTYMHPLTEGLMLGVGFDALEMGDFAYYQGIQVSLFDISNPLDMARVDNHIYGTRGSSSEVTNNHHAFFYDAETALIGMPLTVIGGNSQSGWGGQTEFSGALILRLEQNKLVEAARLTHSEWIPKQCQNGFQWWQDGQASVDINRIYKVDGKILTLSKFGLKAYEAGKFEKALVSTKFSGVDADCNTYSPY